MNREELIRRLILIKELGWVRSTVPAPKNVGELLEALLGLQTNNLSDPDWGTIEVKSKRRRTNTRISLLTRVPTYHDNLSARLFTKKYGYDRESGKALRGNLSAKEVDSRGWKLLVEHNRLGIEHKGSIVAHVDLDDIRQRIEKKLKSLVFVIADSEQRGKWEFFHFNEAYLCTRIEIDNLVKLLRNDELVFDFRMAFKGDKFVDKGTAYRIYSNNLPKLYSSVIRIM